MTLQTPGPNPTSAQIHGKNPGLSYGRRVTLLCATLVAGCLSASCARGEAVTANKLATQTESTTASGSASTPPSSSNGSELSSRLLRFANRLRKGGKTTIEYAPPSDVQRSGYAQLLKQVFRPPTEGSSESAVLPDFEVTHWHQNNIALVSELHSKRRGAGAVAVRTDAFHALVIEAPHTFFDTGTLPIAIELFIGLKARALVINTVHRARSAQASDGPAPLQARSGKLKSDVAHQSGSLFSTAHRTLTEAIPNLRTIQLHGFSNDRLPDFDMVVSAARSRADAATFAKHLREQLPGVRIAAYPIDTRQLGGTTNAQARYSRSAGKPFLHIELSKSLRNRLLAEPQTKSRFIEALRRGSAAQ